jgi:hypothetical protein
MLAEHVQWHYGFQIHGYAFLLLDYTLKGGLFRHDHQLSTFTKWVGITKTASSKIRISRDMPTASGIVTSFFGGTNTSSFPGSLGPDFEVAMPGLALVVGWCGIKNDIASTKHTHTHQ